MNQKKSGNKFIDDLLDMSHRLKAVQPAIMPVGVYWSIRIIDMLNKKQPAFIKNWT